MRYCKCGRSLAHATNSALGYMRTLTCSCGRLTVIPQEAYTTSRDNEVSLDEWARMQVKNVRKWNEDRQLVESWEWDCGMKIFSHPFYRSVEHGVVISGEINEIG